MNNLSYCLITPAKNEELYIRNTIESVLSQTILPWKWVIVDDGSTDNTINIIEPYIEKYNFIKLVKIFDKQERNFASKVYAFNEGYKIIQNEKFDFIGNLDADVSFPEYYYEKIISYFQKEKKLGIAGGISFDMINNKPVYVKNSKDSVRGPVQFFNRNCFNEINGYIPLKGGGIDSIAEYKAKMHGWKVRTFNEISFVHHRRTGSEGYNIFVSGFRRGKQDYSLGYHPLFETLRCLFRIFDKPYFIGSFCILYGYFYSLLIIKEIPLNDNLVGFIRQEQLNKLKLKLFRSL